MLYSPRGQYNITQYYTRLKAYDRSPHTPACLQHGRVHVYNRICQIHLDGLIEMLTLSYGILGRTDNVFSSHSIRWANASALRYF